MNIIGILTRDAEVRKLSNEKQVVNFAIATNDNYRNKKGEKIEQTTYFECAYPTSEEAIQFAGLDHDVEKSPLFTKGTGIIENSNGIEMIVF